jgi:hypothetical protein
MLANLGSFFNSKIDEPLLWRLALRSSQIKMLHEPLEPDLLKSVGIFEYLEQLLQRGYLHTSFIHT